MTVPSLPNTIGPNELSHVDSGFAEDNAGTANETSNLPANSSQMPPHQQSIIPDERDFPIKFNSENDEKYNEHDFLTSITFVLRLKNGSFVKATCKDFIMEPLLSTYEATSSLQMKWRGSMIVSKEVEKLHPFVSEVKADNQPETESKEKNLNSLIDVPESETVASIAYKISTDCVDNTNFTLHLYAIIANEDEQYESIDLSRYHTYKC
ncbi:hypothetical protein COEREDRAFT_89502 [Coemansia reversa NRRL 1564]|uniref:Uncharacterized protein n=1 Tax=Coemansia reversa (strain ATCC 12441 / NRRL 1564) TaxID=763665 RepID=A0A2G5B3E8_COERN|nr:hypothetical protein COEREDRAFT_89502 [Coemansia reversa NRRL 1564]|eukprot:PIA13526.1 hypothetical protein COEREDRAFT_89502 [Coemansia reversa NRRL 1564]